MDDGACDLDTWETRTVRRLTRLFRAERRGGFERRSPRAVQQLIERRGAMIDALIEAETRRRRSATEPSPPFAAALTGLVIEVRRCREPIATRLGWIEAELRLRSGDAPGSGVRGGGGGQLLGRG
jgi:hypothetical protein